MDSPKEKGSGDVCRETRTKGGGGLVLLLCIWDRVSKVLCHALKFHLRAETGVQGCRGINGGVSDQISQMSRKGKSGNLKTVIFLISKIESFH